MLLLKSAILSEQVEGEEKVPGTREPIPFFANGPSISGEADVSFPFRLRRRGHELADSLEDQLKLLIVDAQLLFQFLEFAGQFFVGGQDFAQAHEGPHDGDIHHYGPLALQDTGAWPHLVR